MPFLPLVLLLAWQALSRSASFALGWATALYLGQIPGNKGRVLSVIALLSTGWVVLVVGFALPLAVGAGLDAVGVIGRNFEVQQLTVIGLVLAIVLGPPVIAGVAELAGFEEERRIDRWLRRIPVSYPVAASLGAAVLEMVCITPVLLFLRFRRKQRLLSVPLVLQRSEDTDALVDAIRSALGTIGVDEVGREELTGALSWPLRTMGFAARNLLGSVVHGDPMRLRADGVDLLAYATNVSILGPAERAYPMRAAISKKLGLLDAFLTWTDESQQFEGRLSDLASQTDVPHTELIPRLEAVQAEIDGAAIALDEWNLLYRRRLQVERDVLARDAG